MAVALRADGLTARRRLHRADSAMRMTPQQKQILRRLHEIAQPHRDLPELRKYRIRSMRNLNPVIVGAPLMHVEDARLRKAAFDAIKCFYRVAVIPSFTATDLDAIHHVATSVNRMLREIGVQLLIALGVYHDCARELLFELLFASKVAVRYTMITFFENPAIPLFPPEFVISVIAKGLDDVAQRVRLFAAETAHSFGIHQKYRQPIRRHLTLLIDHLNREKDEAVRNALLFSILRIGEGYELCETEDHAFLLIKKASGARFELVCEVDLPRPYIQSLVEMVEGWGSKIPAAPACAVAGPALA